MKIPYKYKNIRKKDFFWLIKTAEKVNATRNNNLPDDIGLYEVPIEYENYYETYFKEIKNIIKEKLNLYKYAVIYMYTRYDVYKDVNEYLRSFKEIENILNDRADIKLYAILLNKALNKLPSYRNKIVYRFLDEMGQEADTILENFQNIIGKKYTSFQFTSSFCDYRLPSEYVSFEIHTKNKSKGRLIKFISSIDNEQEVLFSLCKKTPNTSLLSF